LPLPRHRVLTSFAERLTGFKITDATDLEENEPDIPLELSEKIAEYCPIHDLDRVFEDQGSECNISFTVAWINQKFEDVLLIQCLVDALRRWTLGSESTLIPVKYDMHEVIASGIGFLEHKESTWELLSDQTYPVHISESLAVLSLCSLFEKQSWTTRQEAMIRSLRTSSNTASHGYVFEEVALVVLMEHFGGSL